MVVTSEDTSHLKNMFYDTKTLSQTKVDASSKDEDVEMSLDKPVSCITGFFQAFEEEFSKLSKYAQDTATVDGLEELLVCSICRETLKDPRTLVCFHSYCKSCLEKVVKDHRDKAVGGQLNEFNCPTCRSQFNLNPGEEVADMPQNYFICNMLAIMGVQDRIENVCCSHCQGPSVDRCSTCEELFWQECLIAHNNYRGVKRLITVEDQIKVEIDSNSKDEDIEMSIDKPVSCENGLQHSSNIVKDEGETSKCVLNTPPSPGPGLEEESTKMHDIDQRTFEYVKARSLALRFMAANPSCIRAVPHDTISTEGHDKPAISMCLYINTHGQGITDDLREKAKKMFSGYNLMFVDLECEPRGEYVTPQVCEDQVDIKKMTQLAEIIEQNLTIFENRLNVTAVYPSYKISDAHETNDLCITVCVLGKGKIPVGEKDFSEVELLSGYPFDIVEGYFALTHGSFLSKASPLHLGVGIGVRGNSNIGTLGAFLTDEENIYALFCQHMVSKLREKQSSEEDFIREKVQLKKRISEKKKLLEELKESGDNDTEMAERIRIIENEVRAPEKDEIFIEQPAEDDFISEIIELKKHIYHASDRRAISSKYHQAISNNLKHMLTFGSPRFIASYSCGVQMNYQGQSDGKFFVDAAIAKINDDEWDIMKNGGLPYHFDKDINGEIVTWKEIETKAHASFWKCGRATGYTDLGRIVCTHFFANLEGFRKSRCFGLFTNVAFNTYCQTCACNIECDLVETSLLNNRTCTECRCVIDRGSRGLELWAYNCFLVHSKRRSFSEEGDSGAVIFDQEGYAWGIIVGVFDNMHFVHSVVISIDIAIQSLSAKLGKKLKLWHGNVDGTMKHAFRSKNVVCEMVESPAGMVREQGDQVVESPAGMVREQGDRVVESPAGMVREQGDRVVESPAGVVREQGDQVVESPAGVVREQGDRDTVDEFKESICSLCGGTVMHPSALSCPHFYCNNCLEKYCTEVVEQVEVNEFLCPLCRVSFDLKPGEKVADFPSDKFTNHLLGLMAHHYSTVGELEERLVCSICKKTWKDPRTLKNCFHSFCKSCLEKVVKDHRDKEDEFYCPTCQSVLNPGEEVADMPKNQFIVNVLQKLDLHPDTEVKNKEQKYDLLDYVRCAFCLKTLENHRVLPCHHHYCQSCLEEFVERHRRWKKVYCPICADFARIHQPFEGNVLTIKPVADLPPSATKDSILVKFETPRSGGGEVESVQRDTSLVESSTDDDDTDSDEERYVPNLYSTKDLIDNIRRIQESDYHKHLMELARNVKQEGEEE